MPELDLVIRGGEVVNAGSRAVVDVGISGERIVALGGELRGREEIDATGMLLLPGVIDAHVHLSGNWVDDYTSGSAAALAGGVTTVGSMTRIPRGETPLTALGREADVVARQAIADVFLHPIISEVNEQTFAEIPALLAAGCNTIKYFMSPPNFDPQALGFLEATRLAGASGLLTMIHCEDYAIIAEATARLTAAGNTSLRYYPESRPVISEVVATQRAVAIAETTGAPVYVVHLSSERALEVCAEARSRGVPVYVEVRPLYLYFTRERFDEPEGPKYLGQPPLRERHDVDALWDGIRQGTVNTVCTDHAPWTLEQKLAADHDINTLRPGMENLQTLLPMLYSEGVRAGRISLSRLVEVLSTNIAKLFGLYPRKGTISVGADADIVVFDPEWSRVVKRGMIKSAAGHSVYEGWEVTGWPRHTLRRGEVVFRDEEVVGAPGSGRLIHRGATQML